ncbi:MULTISPECIES: sensor histidine kinase [Bosea]|uniref:sensor histidine kinase n=1 Tax=Bosea TaxID=85413 RepID=UPI00215007A1|nr:MULTISPECIES: PAS domain-containing sensor histidine kinase [Bosea]MCR4523432.1 PAS domain-containing protein [Bosea sp. 47.2.35]MDR6828495.1 two-component sensor histidine kinase [Bosea robiniae]MDR6895154.1 two-component sensor histidine kinase [Bosea sp. BE109]MDR7138550.1 two-component sensor histidine kinase [Bosea sp. BE168]MDR7175475.1 two-component sensor histidine kinase [Bosea sp. BE271]
MSGETAFLDGGGDMAAAIRDHDWNTTSLGPIAGWPAALKIAVGMMVNSRFPKCIVWGADLTTIHNDAFRPILGDKPPALGRSFRDVWAEVWDNIGPLVDKAFAGEATFIEDFPLTIDRYGHPEETWFTFCYSPVRDEHGRVLGMIDTVMETTGKMEAERNSRLLNAELAHRMKNTLAMIAAIASQTFRSAETLEEAQSILSDRIATLGEAHSILTRSSWSSAPIRAVIDGALAPHRSDIGTIRIDGPPLQLAADQAMTLALAANELATNAVKYGALSVEAGEVSVRWSVGRPQTEDVFRFEWIESGGPAVVKPRRQGFGSRLVERVMAQKFQGEVELDYRPEGLRYVLTTTMAHVAPRE